MPIPTGCSKSEYSLHLLGRFSLEFDGSPVAVPAQSQRVLSYLSVVGRPETREVLAGRLWEDLGQQQAQACLRTALWRIRKTDRQLLRVNGPSVGIGEVVVDFASATSFARGVIDHRFEVTPELPPPGWLREELLPGWEEEWLIFEREQWHQLRVHALECLARRLTAAGLHAAAIDAAWAAVRADPLRDSAHEVLIEAHLAEGNRAEAVRQFTRYAQSMKRELGLAPARRLAQLVM